MTKSSTPINSADTSSKHIWISELRVRNYHSIKDATFRFSQHCNIVIGQNSSGKSNVLEAITLLLTTSNMGLTSNHFYQVNKDVIIEVKLASVDESILRQHRCPAGVEVKLTARWQAAKGVPTTSFVSTRRVEAETKFGKIKDAESFLNDLCAVLRFDYIGTARDYNTLHGENEQNSLYNLLSSFVQSEPSRIEDPFSISLHKVIAMFNEGLNKGQRRGLAEVERAMSLIESCREFAQVDGELRPILKEAGFGVERIVVRAKPFAFHRPPEGKHFNVSSLLKLLHLEVDDGKTARPYSYSPVGTPYTFLHTSLQQHGNGMQSVLNIAVARLLTKMNQVQAIYGIEEPEIGLHPHSQRGLVQMLSHMADTQQVILTTHSPTVAAMWHQRDFADTLIVLERNIAQGTKPRRIYVKDNFTGPELFYLRQRLLATGTEMFFADKVVLVEGKSDVGALSAIARYLGYDLDSRNVSFVDVGNENRGGCSQLPPLIRLLDTLGLPFLTLFDADAVTNHIHTNLRDSLKRSSQLAKAAAEMYKGVGEVLRKRKGALTQEQINEANTHFKLVGCRALTDHLEGVFLSQFPETEYARIYAVYRELASKDFNCLSVDPNHPQHTARDCMRTFLKEESKQEFFWRIMIESLPPGHEEWIADELRGVVTQIVAVTPPSTTA